MAKRLFLIDGTALAYRSFYAFQGARVPLTTSQGHPTSATYGFINTLRALLERERPDAIAIAFDGPRADLTRTKIYAEYKSTRSRMPDEMAAQLADIREATEGYGLTIVESQADEADDVIATLALAGKRAGMQVFVVTGDKDFMQIVDDDIKLWNLRSSTSKPEIYDTAGVQAKWGVTPAQMIDLLALMGDTSDNIPGVPKVGEKTAVELLQQFGSLDALLARTDEVKKASIKQSLIDNRELALLSRQLVTLRTDVPLPVTVDAIGPAQPDPERLRPLFLRLEFTSLLTSLARPVQVEEVATNYQIVRDGRQLDEVLAAVRAAAGCALAVETEGALLRSRKLLGIALAWAPGEAAWVPLTAQPPVLPGGRAAVLEALRPMLQDPTIQKTAADGKRALAACRSAGIEAQGLDFDLGLASYCCQPGIVAHDLDALVLRHFQKERAPRQAQAATGRKQKTFDQIDPALTGNWLCEDADYTLRLRPRLQDELAACKTTAVFAELELPLLPVLLDMEWEGIALDTAHLARTGTLMQQRIDDLQRQVWQRAGSEFNLASPQQVGKVLFDDLEVHRAANLPKPKRTPTGQYKTDHDVLEKMAAHHEVPRLLLEWRMLTKLKGTYVDSLPAMLDPASGRIHTHFNQALAATGRLSSEDPNLQNIPIRTEDGRHVRAAFVARDDGFVLLSADYSQIELRILAHLSGDKALLESFRKGEDIHARTAAIVHGLLPDMVTPELRNQAKIVNYGLMYGMGPSRLAAETGMKPPEARQFIDAYFRALPGVKRYLDASLLQAKQDKEVRTMFGRRRPLPDIDSTNAMLRIAAENMAVNTPIQGAAADIIKRAMLQVHAQLRRRGLRSRLLLQVHDELLLDVANEELAEVTGLVRDAMASAADLRVPLEVAIGHGRTWLQAH
ncbi:MAG: DNA polymerase I [Planctomycetes bacterium]|nr:DNA polymerase I [Planctomycetota bacterium]